MEEAAKEPLSLKVKGYCFSAQDRQFPKMPALPCTLFTTLRRAYPEAERLSGQETQIAGELGHGTCPCRGLMTRPHPILMGSDPEESPEVLLGGSDSVSLPEKWAWLSAASLRRPISVGQLSCLLETKDSPAKWRVPLASWEGERVELPGPGLERGWRTAGGSLPSSLCPSLTPQ